MTFYDIIFYILSAVTVFSAGVTVLSRKKLNIILGLSCAFAGISGLFSILSAVFIALIYLILFSAGLTAMLFFILYYTRNSFEEGQKAEQKNLLFPVLLSGAVSALLGGIIVSTRWKDIPTYGNNFSAGNLSELIMTRYVLPLEITSVIILLVIIGTFYMLRQEKY